MQNYLIYLIVEGQNYYTYIKAESTYLAIAKATKNFTSVQKITIYKELENGDYQKLED